MRLLRLVSFLLLAMSSISEAQITTSWSGTTLSNRPILAQIAVLEQKQARGVRDMLLRNDSTWLTSVDGQISALRAQLK